MKTLSQLKNHHHKKNLKKHIQKGIKHKTTAIEIEPTTPEEPPEAQPQVTVFISTRLIRGNLAHCKAAVHTRALERLGSRRFLQQSLPKLYLTQANFLQYLYLF